MNDTVSEQTHHNWLSSEVDRLETMLGRVASKAQIGERMKVLFASLAAQEKADSEDLRVRAYLYALDGVKMAVLDVVVKRVLQGRYDHLDAAFVPTPPQLSRLCRDEEARLRETLGKHQRSLDAELLALADHRTADEKAAEHEAEMQRMAEKADRLKAVLDGVCAATDAKRPKQKLRPLPDDRIEKAIRIMETFHDDEAA